MTSRSPATTTPQTAAQPAQRSVVSEETRARWRTMLAAQIGGGRPYDLGQLVESVVGRICDEQSASISVAAKSMSGVEQTRDAVAAEVARAQAILTLPGGETLKAPYAGVTIERTEGAAQPQLRKGQLNSTMNRSHVLKFCKSTPLESLIYTRKMLNNYTEKLLKQQTALENERVALEQKMKKSLEERTKIVSNLSMVSKELYSLATEVAASLPAPPGGARPTTAPVPSAAPAAAAAPAAPAPKKLEDTNTKTLPGANPPTAAKPNTAAKK